MALTLLNDVAALNINSSLSLTQARLQTTLTQFSTGMRINTGADDAAGLSIVNGMQANIAALTQSAQNAVNGIGALQTADGIMSQVTTMLDRAITLATEAANGDLTPAQSTSLDQEFTSIKAEITQVTDPPDSAWMTMGYEHQATQVPAGSVLRYGVAGTPPSWSDPVEVTSDTTIPADGGNAFFGVDPQPGSPKIIQALPITVFLSDADTAETITAGIYPETSVNLGLSTTSLTSASDAAQALTALNSAVNSVAYHRGNIGAKINQLTATSSVMTVQVQNLTSTVNNISNADVGQVVTNMTQETVLQSMGMFAMQRATQSQQAVLKLLS